MTLAAGMRGRAGTVPAPPSDADLLPPRIGYRFLTDTVVAPLQRPAGRGWWRLMLCAVLLDLAFVVAVTWLLISGVGIWGINSDVVWGFAIANYVWWIGIGNAGTLISALLLITRQRWRASISRFAEAMTLFAAAIAGLFPILHLGRPWLFYWLTPYLNTMALWPQWRSPLVWDFFAIASYILFSLMFWYTGAIPDLATMRDRATSRRGRVLYGWFALGWRGSARHWQVYERYYLAMAALGVPLVVSVHSVVGLDFAASLMPGWQETIFPPYFVVGAAFSGFAVVVLLALVLRKGLALEAVLTARHFDVMAKVMLFCAIVMTLSYSFEWYGAFLSGDARDRAVVSFEFTGPYAWMYLLMLACNGLFPQVFWVPALRRDHRVLAAVAVGVLVGMWLERILIIVVTLGAGNLPSGNHLYVPTLWDVMLFAGTIGLFLTGFLLFVRLVPVVSIHEVKEMGHERAVLP